MDNFKERTLDDEFKDIYRAIAEMRHDKIQFNLIFYGSVLPRLVTLEKKIEELETIIKEMEESKYAL